MILRASSFAPLPLLALLACSPALAAPPAPPRPLLLVHGGAGTIRRGELTPELERQYRAGLESALREGWSILDRGGSALDAVETAVRSLEDDPLFNAGRGAVFTRAGTHELDASIMDGATMCAGAVAGVETIRHPVSAARAVMELSPHVLLAGRGAERFAAAAGLELVDPAWFDTEKRWLQLQERLLEEGTAAPRAGGMPSRGTSLAPPRTDGRLGTVGAVALDRSGHLAAATSTGGMTAKMPGRIGDSPIVGAGCWAEDGVVAVSSTGDGEFFIRLAVAKEIASLVSIGRLSPAEGARRTIRERLTGLGGTGGVIALGADGSFAFEMNTAGMYRGWIDPDGRPRTAIFAEEGTR
jgi:beta-aspartyl-peptidase (threonine type)